MTAPDPAPATPPSWSHPRYSIIDRGVPLSRSSLWSLSAQWYAAQGPQAWRIAGVPWYITSNSAIAGVYAEVALGVIRDTMAADPDRPPSRRRLEILEVCGGLGQFAYLFLARLLPLLAASAHADWSVRYVLTDGADDNVQAWATHPSFRRLLAGGVLEVATLDATNPDFAGFCGPLLLVANYAFDSLPADLFRVEEGELFERPVTIGIPNVERLSPGVSSLSVTFGQRPASAGTGSAYDDDEFRAILDGYGEALSSADFLFPTAGLGLLRDLVAATDGPVVAFISDRACGSIEELAGGAGARIDLQGGPVWATVNLHAVARWTEQRGGVALLRPSVAGNLQFAVFAFGSGDQAHNSGTTPLYTETRQAFFRGLAPDDLFSIQKQFDDGLPDDMTPAEAVAYLELFGWDPGAFANFAPLLINAGLKLDDRVRRALERGARAVWSLYFPSGHPDDVPLLLGRLMARIARLDLAISWLQAAINLRGAESAVLLELGACLWRNGQRSAGRAAVEAAVSLDPDDEEARSLALRLAAEGDT